MFRLPFWSAAGVILHRLLTALPWSLVAALYLMSWRAMAVTGHWPVANGCGPYTEEFFQQDGLLYLLHLSIDPLMLAFAFSVLLWLPLLIILGVRQCFSNAYILASTVIYSSGFLFFLLDIDKRLNWIW
jgi:hypothetical protein